MAYDYSIEAKKLISLRDNIIKTAYDSDLANRDPNELDESQKSLQIAFKRYILEEQLKVRSSTVGKLLRAKKMGRWNQIPFSDRGILETPSSLKDALTPDERIPLHPGSTPALQTTLQARRPPPPSSSLILSYEEPEIVSGQAVPSGPASYVHQQLINRSRPEETNNGPPVSSSQNFVGYSTPLHHQHPPGLSDYTQNVLSPPPGVTTEGWTDNNNNNSHIDSRQQSHVASSPVPDNNKNEATRVPDLSVSSENVTGTEDKTAQPRDAIARSARTYDQFDSPISVPGGTSSTIPIYSDSSPIVPEVVEPTNRHTPPASNENYGRSQPPKMPMLKTQRANVSHYNRQHFQQQQQQQQYQQHYQSAYQPIYQRPASQQPTSQQSTAYQSNFMPTTYQNSLQQPFPVQLPQYPFPPSYPPYYDPRYPNIGDQRYSTPSTPNGLPNSRLYHSSPNNNVRHRSQRPYQDPNQKFGPSSYGDLY